MTSYFRLWQGLNNLALGIDLAQFIANNHIIFINFQRMAKQG
jgi:hypothetical protein